MASLEAAHLARAEGTGATTHHLYTGSDDEGADSSILADLASMFPAVEYSELVTILRSHGGDLDATVDYLMALSLHTEIGGSTNVIHQGLQEAEDSSYGQFSDEIGGLPSIMSCNQTDSDADDEWEEGEEDAPVNHGGNAKEALPSSCEEAMLSMRGGSREGDGYVVAGCIMLPKQTDEVKGRVMDGEGVPVATSTLPQHHKQPRPHKKHKRPKKLRKLAGKLNVKKDLDYKAEQERRIEEPAYQPLLPIQVNGEDSREPDTVNT